MRRGRRARARNILAIEGRFGKPLKEILDGLRAQGSSWRDISETLDIKEITLIQWRRSLFIPIDSAKRGRNRAGIVREIEAEFDEPIRDVIVGMREQRCNWTVIAGVLGIGRNTLNRWRKLWKIEA